MIYIFLILGLIVFVSLVLFADDLQIEGLSNTEIMIVACVIGVIAFGVGMVLDIMIY